MHEKNSKEISISIKNTEEKKELPLRKYELKYIYIYISIYIYIYNRSSVPIEESFIPMEKNKEYATYVPIPVERAGTDNEHGSTNPAAGNTRKTIKTKSVSKEIRDYI